VVNEPTIFVDLSSRLDYFGMKDFKIRKEYCQFSRVWSVHRIDWIEVVGILLRNCKHQYSHRWHNLIQAFDQGSAVFQVFQQIAAHHPTQVLVF
jgi:hypothetical protein